MQQIKTKRKRAKNILQEKVTETKYFAVQTKALTFLPQYFDF